MTNSEVFLKAAKTLARTRSNIGSCCLVWEAATGRQERPYDTWDLDRHDVTSAYITTFANESEELGYLVDRAVNEGENKVNLRIMLLCMAAAVHGSDR